MPKPGRSSATSATRKKHAKKAVGESDAPPVVVVKPSGKKGKKAAKNESPRVKAYIPPVKPQAARPDPLDGLTGIDGDLYVILRALGKKSVATKGKAMTDLTRYLEENPEGTIEQIMSVWLHFLPTLFLHPDRRIRHQAAILHTAFFASAVPKYLELGTWLLLAHDVDRDVAAVALQSWTTFYDPEYAEMDHLLASTRRAILDPRALVLEFLSESELEQEKSEDLDMRMRAAGLGTLGYLINFGSAEVTVDDDTLELLSTPALWSCLYPHERAPFLDDETAFGHGQPGVRRAAWTLVSKLPNRIYAQPQVENSDAEPVAILPLLSAAILRSVFVEEDATVHASSGMWRGVLGFLKANPNAWELERSYEYPSDDDEEDLDAPTVESSKRPSEAYRSFLHFLASGCFGAGVQVYPAVVVLLSSLDSEIMASIPTSPESSALLSFLDVYPKALSSRAFTGGSAGGTRSAQTKLAEKWLESWIECLSFLARRICSPSTAQPSSSNPPSRYRHATLLLNLSESDIGKEQQQILLGTLAGLVKAQIALVCREAFGLLVPPPSDETPEDGPKVTKAKVRVDGSKFGDIISNFLLGSLRTIPTSDRTQQQPGDDFVLFNAAWDSIQEAVEAAAFHTPAESSALRSTNIITFLPPFLRTLSLSFTSTFFPAGSLDHAQSRVFGLVQRLLDKCLRTVESALLGGQQAGEPAELLVQMLAAFKTKFEALSDVIQRLDTFISTHVFALIQVKSRYGMDLIQAYIAVHIADTKSADLWHTLLEEIATNFTPSLLEEPENVLDLESTLARLVDIHDKQESLKDEGRMMSSDSDADRVGTGFNAEGEELDQMLQSLMDSVLNGQDDRYLGVLKRILSKPDPFISKQGLRYMLRAICSAFNSAVDELLKEPEEDPDSEPHSGDSQKVFEQLLSLLSAGYPTLETLPPSQYAEDALAAVTMAAGLDSAVCLLSRVYLLVYVVPKINHGLQEPVFSLSMGLWKKWITSESGGGYESFSYWDDSLGPGKRQVADETKKALKRLLQNVRSRVRPDQILQAVVVDTGVEIDIFKAVIPTRYSLDKVLAEVSPDPIDSSLAVLDPSLPPRSYFSRRNVSVSVAAFDSTGCSSYVRIVLLMLQAMFEDRQTAKENMWALRHLITLYILAEDYHNVPTATSTAFHPRVLIDGTLLDIITKVRSVSTYLLRSNTEEGWRPGLLNALIKDESTHSYDPLCLFLMDTIQSTQSRDDLILEQRVLKFVLERVLEDADRAEAEKWVAFAKHFEKEAPFTSGTIISAITEHAPDPSLVLERTRNELAASLMGLPASKANNEGLATLLRLVAFAPRLDADVAFLPPQRALNIVKTCQKWASSDGDVNEEVETAMTLIFWYLAPLLQNVPGAHWDFIFDVIEGNLQTSELTNDADLVILARTLRLIIIIQDLVATNKTLRADWDMRKTSILTLVRELASIRLDTSLSTAPRSSCRELVLSIVQDLPISLIDHTTLAKMTHLLTDPSTEVQKMTFNMLKLAAKKRTEHTVIEAAMDTTEEFKAQLPPELLDILQRTVGIDDGEDTHQEQIVFGYYLSWIILFELFNDSSLKVRSNFVDQLRRLDIIPSYFMPGLISRLVLNNGIPKAFKLEPWAVDEFHVEYYEPGSDFGLEVLIAHTYYRALLTVPSLIHTWLQDCKDRQTSTTLMTYTATHFSSIIVQRELAHVRLPEALAELETENLKVKVLGATNEVVASYQVEEYQLEMRLKIPSDWPLHKIEVRDTKRVGVDEARWRAWIFAVQQTIWNQNGRLVDGLELFKKNVTGHFEGQVECAICYSIISVMDGSFPKKPCKTCKNRFHAGCLFKWFNTSHSSSCPLCRSDIL